MGDTPKWKEPGTLRPLSDPIAQTPQREEYEKVKELARLILESYDWDLVIYAKLQEIRKREMKPGEAEIWEAIDQKNFRKIEELAEKLLDEEPEYGWGYFYQLLAEFRVEEGPIGLYIYMIPPNGLLVSQEEPEDYHRARLCYKRARRFADDSLKKMFVLLEQLAESNQLYDKAKKALENGNYRDVMLTCAKMPFRKYLDSGEFVEKAMQVFYDRCKKAEFARLKESGYSLEQAVKERHPSVYNQWKAQKDQAINYLCKAHGAEKTTMVLAIIALALSLATMRSIVPISMLLLGFALETMWLEFHFFRGLLVGVLFTGITMAPGLIMNITDHWYYLLGMSVVSALLSLWFLRCGICDQKYTNIRQAAVRWDDENVRPVSEELQKELWEEYEMVPGITEQLKKWSEWYQW